MQKNVSVTIKLGSAHASVWLSDWFSSWVQSREDTSLTVVWLSWWRLPRRFWIWEDRSRLTAVEAGFESQLQTTTFTRQRLPPQSWINTKKRCPLCPRWSDNKHILSLTRPTSWLPLTTVFFFLTFVLACLFKLILMEKNNRRFSLKAYLIVYICI